MGGVPGCCDGVWVSFHWIPHLDSCLCTLCVWAVGVAGWNTKSFSGWERVGFGTLLGPEETPFGGCFLVATVSFQCLTSSFVGVVVLRCSGCVVVC